LVIAAPPVLVGASQLALAVSAPPAAPWVGAWMIGRPGRVAGVTAADAADSVPVPTEFVAATRKLYAVPLFRLSTSRLVAVPVSVIVR
jgi:hypothetical protein